MKKIILSTLLIPFAQADIVHKFKNTSFSGHEHECHYLGIENENSLVRKQLKMFRSLE